MRELSGHMERAVYGICKGKEGSLDNIKTPKQLLPTGDPTRWDPDQLPHPLFCSATSAAMGLESVNLCLRTVGSWMWTVKRGCTAVLHSAQGSGVLCLRSVPDEHRFWMALWSWKLKVDFLPSWAKLICHLIMPSSSDSLLLLLFQQTIIILNPTCSSRAISCLIPQPGAFSTQCRKQA